MVAAHEGWAMPEIAGGLAGFAGEVRAAERGEGSWCFARPVVGRGETSEIVQWAS